MLPAIVSRRSPGARFRGTTASTLPAAEAVVPRSRSTIEGNNPFLPMSWFSLLQMDVEVEKPETSEDPTQSFEIHNIVWKRTQILAVIIYII